MKNILLVAVLLTMTLTSFGQITIGEFYEDEETYLISSSVVEVDSMSQSDIISKIKNWGGVNFANMREVLVSETDNQLVFNYTTSSFYMKTLGMKSTLTWYIRLFVQVKEGRYKLSMYDDGNAFMSGGHGVPSLSARTNHIDMYFQNKSSKERHQTKAKKMFSDGIESLKLNCEKTMEDITESVNSKEMVDNDW